MPVQAAWAGEEKTLWSCHHIRHLHTLEDVNRTPRVQISYLFTSHDHIHHVRIQWNSHPLLLFSDSKMVETHPADDFRKQASHVTHQQHLQMGLRKGMAILLYYAARGTQYQAVLIAEDSVVGRSGKGENRLWKRVTPTVTEFAWLPPNIAESFCRNALYRETARTYHVFSLCVFCLCFLSVFSVCVFCLCLPSVFSVCVFCLCFLSVLSLCVFSLCFLSVFSLCVFSLRFRSVFSVCVFPLCFLSVFSPCVFSLCVFPLCFLSVFSPCVFSLCVFSLCFLSAFSLCVFSVCFLSVFLIRLRLLPHFTTKNDTFLSINFDIILLWSGLADQLLFADINTIKGWWSANSQLI